MKFTLGLQPTEYKQSASNLHELGSFAALSDQDQRHQLFSESRQEECQSLVEPDGELIIVCV